MSAGLVEIEQRLYEAWEPPPDLLVSEWANRERKLSREASAEHGDFDMNRTPYMREVVDSVIDIEVRETWLMKSAQIAYTENLFNIIGYFVDQDACPMMMIQPTKELAEAISKDRISPMIRDTPALTKRIDDKSKTSGNTILHKKFAGGHLTLGGANSPASLSSRPIRGLMCDEVDRFPASAGEEGDPISIGKKRQITFKEIGVDWFFAGGTPTIKGVSRTEKGYERGDQRKYFVPCHHCKDLVTLEPDRLCRDEESEEFGKIQCPACEKWMEHRFKLMMIRDELAGGCAEWRPTSTGPEGVRSYYIWAAYSPWVRWEDIAREWNEVEGDLEMEKPFENTVLGRTYEEAGEAPDEETLLKKREKYDPGGIPDEVVVITAGGDVQHDRIELEICGWGEGEESWSIDYRTFWGDTSGDEVWADLDEYLESVVFTRKDASQLKIRSLLMDASDGQRSDRVYRWARGKKYRNIYACKGESQPSRPIVSRVSKLKKQRISLVLIGTDTAKSLIYERLELTGSGPGRCHFPITYGPKYFEMLTAEEKIIEYKAGVPIMRWVPRTVEDPKAKKEDIGHTDKKGRKLKRNEALDCRVYALAALRMLPTDLKALARRRQRQLQKAEKSETAEEENEPATAEETPAPKKRSSTVRKRKSARRKKGGWMST